jgi:hypothetical protein
MFEFPFALEKESRLGLGILGRRHMKGAGIDAWNGSQFVGNERAEKGVKNPEAGNCEFLECTKTS